MSFTCYILISERLHSAKHTLHLRGLTEKFPSPRRTRGNTSLVVPSNFTSQISLDRMRVALFHPTAVPCNGHCSSQYSYRLPRKQHSVLSSREDSLLELVMVLSTHPLRLHAKRSIFILPSRKCLFFLSSSTQYIWSSAHSSPHTAHL